MSPVVNLHKPAVCAAYKKDGKTCSFTTTDFVTDLKNIF